MPTSPLAHFPLLLFLTWSFLTLTTQAEIGVQGALSPQKVALGDQTQLTIQIRGTNSPPPQPDIQVAGLEIQPAGTTRSISIGPGGQVVFVSYTYLVTPDKIGDYQIPAQELTIEGQKYSTQPLTLNVVETAALPDDYQPILRLECGKTEVFEGEIFPMTISVMIHQDTGLNELPMPQLPRENFTMKRFHSKPERTSTEFKGVNYIVFHYRTSISALKPGDLTLGPAELKLDVLVPDPSRRRDPFGGVGARSKTYRIKSDPLTIKSKPLPTEGKPQNFSGAVGNFALQVQAHPLALKEGDPISATLYVSGTGNFETLVSPEMEDQDGWRLYPSKLAQENRNSGLEPGSVVFTQVIIPETVKAAVPSFVLNFFNPESGSYGVVKSNPLPLQVTAVPKTAAKSEATGVKDYSTTSAPPPKESLKDILGLQYSPSPLLPLTMASPSINSTKIVHGTAIALLIGIFGWALMRKLHVSRKIKLERPAPALSSSQILHQLRQEHGSLRSFYSMAAEFLKTWESENPNTHVGDALAATKRQIHQRRDFYAYGAATDSTQSVPASEHSEILAALKQL